MSHMICPVVKKNTYCLEAWLKRHLDEVIAQHTFGQQQGSI